MTVNHTIQLSYEAMRTADVTADESLIDPTGSDSNKWISEFTRNDVYELGPEANAVEIIGWAEADDTDYVDFQLWGGAQCMGKTVASFLCEVSAQCGAAIADITNADSTERLFIDTMSITSQAHVKSIVVDDNGNNRFAKISLDTTGLKYLLPMFTNIGDTTEANRANLYIRKF